MNKSFFKSKTILGIIIALVMVTLNAFHVNVTLPGADADSVTLLQSLIGLAAMAYAIYGRIKADLSGAGKAWYQSKTILGIIMAVAITVLNYFHVNIPVTELFGITPDQATQQLGNGILADITLVMSIIGRVKADRPITK